MSSLQERLRRLSGQRRGSAGGQEGQGGMPFAHGEPFPRGIGEENRDGTCGDALDEAVRGEDAAGRSGNRLADGRQGGCGDGGGKECGDGRESERGGGQKTGIGSFGENGHGAGCGDDNEGMRAGRGLPSFGRIAETEYGCFILREKRYPLDHEHGHYALGDLAGRHERLNRVSRRYAGIKPVESLGGLLFFDTETTGLGVGAGNVPFMIGLGFFEEREFVVQQLFVRDPGEELAMLVYFRRFAERFTHLVTYNGKSFDWPVLANRYVLHRIPPACSRLEHLDLLYMSRNLWRSSLDSCRLSRVEEERLGIRREQDVPGYLAPVLYFQYLSDGDIRPMESVFRHNEWDLLTLVTLAAHLGAVLSGDAEWGKMEAEDLYRTGIWLLEADLPDLAERPFAALIERPKEAAGYAARLARAYKKMRRYDKAVPLWEQAARLTLAGPWLTVSEQSLEPLVELAIYHEHRSGRLDEALRWTEEALNRVERLSSLYARVHGNADKVRRWKAELVRRRNRLAGKMRKRAGTSRSAATAASGPPILDAPEAVDPPGTPEEHYLQLQLDWRT